MEPQIFRVVKSKAALAGNRENNIGETDIERVVQGGFLEEVAFLAESGKGRRIQGMKNNFIFKMKVK